MVERVLLPHHRGRGFWPERLAGDKGYSYRPVRRGIRRRGIRGVIPTRKDQPRDLAFEKAQYRRRNIVERAVGWYKECRRLATRYEKLAVNYPAFWMVAMIEKDLRLLGFWVSQTEPSPGVWCPARLSRTSNIRSGGNSSSSVGLIDRPSCHRSQVARHPAAGSAGGSGSRRGWQSVPA